MIEGLFIVIEGIDGAGTTTHSRLLAETLRARGLPIRSTREPSDGPIGVMIRQILSGRLVVPGMAGPRPPSWATMALLFAADRVDHVESEILPNLVDGVTVISDRYDHSSVAYQSVTGAAGAPETVAWLRTINAQARRPDLTIVLDVSDDIARARRNARRVPIEIYDDDELQSKLAAFYRDIDRYFPKDKIVHVPSDGAVSDVAATILGHVEALREGRPSRAGG